MEVRFEYTVELVGNELVSQCSAMPEEWRNNATEFRGIGGQVLSLAVPALFCYGGKAVVYLRGDMPQYDYVISRMSTKNPDRDFSLVSNLLREFVDAAFVVGEAAGFRIGVLKIETLNRITVKLVSYD